MSQGQGSASLCIPTTRSPSFPLAASPCGTTAAQGEPSGDVRLCGAAAWHQLLVVSARLDVSGTIAGCRGEAGCRVRRGRSVWVCVAGGDWRG